MEYFNFKIEYGSSTNKIDVTDILLDNLIDNQFIYIPNGDENRSILFCSDPHVNVLKNI